MWEEFTGHSKIQLAQTRARGEYKAKAGSMTASFAQRNSGFRHAPIARVHALRNAPVVIASRTPRPVPRLGHGVAQLSFDAKRVEYNALGHTGVSSELSVDTPRHQPAQARRHRCGDASTGTESSLLNTAVPAPLRTGLPEGADVGGASRATGSQGPGTERFHHAERTLARQNVSCR